MKVFKWDNRISKEKIIQAKKELIEYGVLKDPSPLRPFIAESWLRCYQRGINPDSLNTSQMLSDEEYEEKFRENYLLMEKAVPIIDKLYSVLNKSQYAVSLFSPEGYPIYYYRKKNITMVDKLRNILMKICWREEVMGTCSFSVVSQLKLPVQMLGAEFYLNIFQNTSTSLSPIEDGWGNFSGMIGISSKDPIPHPYILGLAMCAAEAIGKELKCHLLSENINFEGKSVSVKDILEDVSDGILLLDERGRIEEVNPKAEEILQIKKEEMKFKKPSEIVESGLLLDDTLTNLSSLSDQPITLKLLSRKILEGLLSIKPLSHKTKGDMGAVLILKDMKSKAKVLSTKSPFRTRYSFEDIIGKSRKIFEVKNQALLASKTPFNILIEGETGTGKEIFAHGIHSYSHRKDGPFISINCSAIPSELFESLLFGYEKGAFTGAKHEGHKGKFEQAHGGSLFLDEVGELPLNLQVKLLRVISEGRLDKVGGSESIPIDVRLISATNQPLEQKIKEGKFRLDLFYRLNVINIKLPPLRERREDIPFLVDYLLDKIALQTGKRINKVSPEFMALLEAHDWPGNIRELENVLERTLSFCEEDRLEAIHLPEYLRKEKESNALGRGETWTEVEKQLIEETLKRFNGNKTRTALHLGIGRDTLYRKIKYYNIGGRVDNKGGATEYP